MYSFAKRALDITVASICLLVLLPLIAAVALAIRIIMRESALFKQMRIGREDEPFELLKFRTMRTAYDSRGHQLPDSARLTPLGSFLRKSSIDELPQLWNVLKGDMSLVGPRPLLPKYLPRYSTHQRRRHEVQAGITGWAQINGRNALSWEERFNLDVWYADHCSFGLDLKIIFLTIVRIFRREGINQPGHATMAEFMGSERS